MQNSNNSASYNSKIGKRRKKITISSGYSKMKYRAQKMQNKGEKKMKTLATTRIPPVLASW